MKFCSRIQNFVQVSDSDGSVKLCGWLYDSVIGKLTENSLEEIWHGPKAQMLRNKLANGDYSCCRIDSCPHLSTGTIEKMLIEVDEIPPYPDHLYLGYDHTCNYRCTVCYYLKEHKIERDVLEKKISIIEKHLKPILPHLKYIGANGCGELFASPSILKLLSEWRPIAPPEEIHVDLETNGSLFDEQHWKKIENLGQYDLTVHITVMSFDEHTYQTLSGCKLPISKLESNLRFVKKLREQGIINRLDIATVVQERNFPTLPEFARRCVEEFNADYVRLRPFEANRSLSPEVNWLTDIRGRTHPYHKEYLEIMKDPIFKHPKVHDWSGGRESQVTDLPQNIQIQNLQALRTIETNVLGNILLNDDVFVKLAEVLNLKGGGLIYGVGVIGLSIAKKLREKCRIHFIIDLKMQGQCFADIPIVSPDNVPMNFRFLDVIFTDLQMPPAFPDFMKKAGYSGKFIHIKEIFPFLFQ